MVYAIYLILLQCFLLIAGKEQSNLTAAASHFTGPLAFRAKNSYSIERRPIDYVPTATLGSCCGRVPSHSSLLES
jgi:hypothetical protein